MLTKEEARGAVQGYYVLYRKKANVWENKTVNGKETTSFLVTPLEKFTLYEFAMQAFNIKGVSDLSTTLEETTAEDSKFFALHIKSLIISCISPLAYTCLSITVIQIIIA